MPIALDSVELGVPRIVYGIFAWRSQLWKIVSHMAFAPFQIAPACFCVLRSW